jgi:hypothetical protein
MSGTAKVKPPLNNAEWARNTEKRLNQAENPTSTRVGEWVLSTQANSGNLIASHVEGGSVTLAVKPAPSADAADLVTGNDFPHLKVERQVNQSGTRGTTVTVQWDTLIEKTDEWGFVPTSSDILIPVDGTYLCIYHLAFLNASAEINKGVFRIDGLVKMAQEFDPNTAWYQSMYMVDTFDMTAGALITCGAYVPGSGTFDFGASGADTSVYTSLSMTRLPVG